MAANRKGNERQKHEQAARPEESMIDFGDFEPRESSSAQADQVFSDNIELSVLADITDQPLGETDAADEQLLSGYLLGGDDGTLVESSIQAAVVEDNIEDFFKNFEYSNPSSVDEFVDEVSRVIGGEEERVMADAIPRDNAQSKPVQPEKEIHAEPEPDLISEAHKYSAGNRGIKTRSFFAFAFAAIAVWLTFAFERGGWLPFGVSDSVFLCCGVLLILQLVNTALSVDVLWKGMRGILRLSFSAESMIVLSGIFTLVDGVHMLSQQDMSAGLPFCALFCAASACSLAGEYCYRSSMGDSLTEAAMLQAQIGVVSDIETLEGRTILKKMPRAVSGFYRSITQEDCAETAYRTSVPLFLIVAVGLAALVSIGKDDIKVFLHAFAALLSVSASFTSVLSFPLPFRIVTSYAKKAGAAIAGWGGAQAVVNADGALLVDEDIFPVGTVGIENASVFGEDKQKAILAASSLVIASGSGMGRCFADLLKQQRLSMARVYNFAYSESGGIQGVIKGERIYVGNFGYMNLIGIRVPPEREKNNAVYLAIGKKLYARFDMTYLPANAVQKSLLSLSKAGVNLLFAVRDFNVTPASVRQKFKVPTDDIEHLTVPECYAVTENRTVTNCDCMAVLGKDGAGAFAAAIAGSCTLRNMALVSTVVSVAGSAIGLLLLFSLLWFGDGATLQVGNIILYMLTNALVQVVLTIFTRKT